MSSSKSSSKSSAASSSQSSSIDRKQPSKDRQNAVNIFKLDKGRGFTNSNSITITDLAFEMKFKPAGASGTQPKNTPSPANVPPTQGKDVKPKSPKPSSRQN